MTRPSALRLFVLLALPASLLACAASRTPSASPAASVAAPSAQGPVGRIEGKVTEQDGSPVGGCYITVTHRATGGRWTARADMEGNFLLLDLPEGSGYRVAVSTPPIWRTSLKNIEVRAGQATHLQVVRRLLRGGGPLSADEPVR